MLLGTLTLNSHARFAYAALWIPTWVDYGLSGGVFSKQRPEPLVHLDGAVVSAVFLQIVYFFIFGIDQSSPGIIFP